MKEVYFQKFTSYGNNFIIVDETQSPQLLENEKSRFACQVTNVNFGIGADGVLFLQPYRSDVLAEINATRHYWDKIPVYPRVDMMFRIFEPNGVESYSCGNGLMCLAAFLKRQYNIDSKRILTQIPTTDPKVITIGTDTQKNVNWANMGSPKRIPQDIVNLSDMTQVDPDIDKIDDISITFREKDLHPFSNKNSINLNGFLVYTGEPHLVIFPDFGISLTELKNVLFVSSHLTPISDVPYERRTMFGSWLIHHVGMHLNKRYSNIFPNGINVNFVNIPAQGNVLEYRCFERGINKETLACGTGALAVSFVARHLNMIQSQKITVWPHRSRWYDPEAYIMVEENQADWSISGKPVMLFEGKFLLNKFLSEQIASVLSEPLHKGSMDLKQEEKTYRVANINY